MAAAAKAGAVEALLRPLHSIAFQKQMSLPALPSAGRSVFVVGRKEALCKAAAQLGEILGTPYLQKQAEAITPGYKGTTVESPWTDTSGQVRKVTLVALPEAAGRLVSPTRPDAIAKLLHGKIAGQEVLLAVPEADALAAGIATARCLPPYSAKVERKDGKPPPEASTCNVGFFGFGPSDEVVARLSHAATYIRLAQGLVDRPPNVLDTVLFRDVALEAAKSIPGVKAEVIEGEELRKRGYGLLYNVGKSAPCPPCLVVLTHPGKGGGAKGVALVGKGITFDTGGAALKSRDGMTGMKRDMGGAAGVLGAFLTVAKAGGLPSGKPLHCVLCLAENGIGRDMFKQDDIITGYSGLTVEINNTDAEGRLVLADGVSHVAKHLDCELVIDMATLTGAQHISTGMHHGLLLATDDALEQDAIAAGLACGDYVHPGLFMPELLMHEYDSEFADMKNSVKNRGNAQSSCAGLFIYKHLMHSGYNGRWMHVDMSCCAFKPLDDYGTGYGVGLLSTFLAGAPGCASSPRGTKRPASSL